MLEQALAADERLTRGRADLVYVTGDLVQGFETVMHDLDGPPLQRWLIDVNFIDIADLDLEPGDKFDPAMLLDVRGVRYIDAIEPAVDEGRPA